MSRVSISKSYAVLVGIEGYMKTKKRIQQAEKDMKHQADKVTHPEKAREEEERMKDKSKSAEKERKWLEKQRAETLRKEEEEKQKKKETGLTARLKKRLGFGTKDRAQSRQDSAISKPDVEAVEKPASVAGSGPEEGVPPPEGKR